MTGRVIHTGQVLIDLTMRLDALPPPGGDAFADDTGMHVGGGYNVLFASRRLAVETVFAGTMGSGRFNDMAAKALAAIGVAHVGATVPGDLGYCVAITDATAERTFISTRGAESLDPVDAFDSLSIHDRDVLYLTGYSLNNARNRAALERLVARLGGPVCRTVFDVSPVVADAPVETLGRIAKLRPLWSMNEREARILAERLGLDGSSTDLGSGISRTGTVEVGVGVGARAAGTDAVGGGAGHGGLASHGLLRTGPALAGHGVPGEGGAVAWGEDTGGSGIERVLGGDRSGGIAGVTSRLAERLGEVLVRVGPAGAWYSKGGAVEHVPTIEVTPVDTNGAGDAHSGVLCAALARGVELRTALAWANVAGALSTTVHGPATCPNEAEIRQAWRRRRLTANR